MDELTAISEALQQVVGPGWEWVFGYGVAPHQAAELCVVFLLAPYAQPEELAQRRAAARTGSQRPLLGPVGKVGAGG